MYKGRVWRYQRGNQNPNIEEGQTTQWPEEKVQKEKQRSTKHTYKTKDRVTLFSVFNMSKCWIFRWIIFTCIKSRVYNSIVSSLNYIFSIVKY
jgi:hypothetical protein